MQTITLKIIGMHCTSCAMNIDGELEDNIKGIKTAKTSYATQECEVAFDETKVDISKIVAQVKQTGYKAEIKNS